MLLDAILPIRLSAEDEQRHSNALRATQRLAAGLVFLYEGVKAAERHLATSTPEGMVECVWGNDPRLNAVRQDLLECSFHWYAVSLVNFVRANASIHFDDQREPRNRYVEDVLGPVRSFRDKIAAHFAGMTGSGRDNDAERLVSLIPQITWMAGRLQAGTWVIRIQRGSDVSDSASIAPWRLTEVHEQLCQRYPMLVTDGSTNDPASPNPEP